MKDNLQISQKEVDQVEERLVFRQGAWLEERDISISISPNWQINEYRLQESKPVMETDIQAAFSKPIGTNRLFDLAKGKKRIVIIVDDLSRPTPAYLFLPYILKELKEAGAGEGAIRFVVAVGGHRPLSDKEIQLKIGKSYAEHFPVRNHDFASDDLVSMGRIGHGIPVHIDPWVAEADFKIGIGSIIPHDSAGFSGGGKCIVPGVSGFATLLCFHGLFQKRGRGISNPVSIQEDFRHCIDEIAQKVGLDFIVNCVVCENREVAKVTTGDPVLAFKEGERFAQKIYSFFISRENAERINLVLANAYPLDVDPEQIGKALEAAAAFRNAQIVLFDSGVDRVFYRGLYFKIFPGSGKRKKKSRSHSSEVQSTGRYAKLKRRIRKSGVLPAILSNKIIYSKFREKQISYEKFIKELAISPSSHNAINLKEIKIGDLVVISPHIDVNGFYKRFPRGVLFRDWESAFAQLQKLHPRSHVAVLPYSPLQIPVIK